MSDNLLAIVMSEGTAALEELPADTPLAERMRVSMRACRNHYLVLDEDVQMRAAIGAVYAKATDAEKERIEDELAQLRSLSALMAGVPVDLDRMEPLADPIGLVKLWRESAVRA